MTLVKFSDARTPILAGLRKSLGGSESCVSCRVAWLLGGLVGWWLGWWVGLRDIADASQVGWPVCLLLHKAGQDISYYGDPTNVKS